MLLVFSVSLHQASISKEGDGESVALAVVNTIIAASFSAMTAMILNNVILTLAGDSSKWSLLTTVNGSLIGIISMKATAYSKPVMT